VLCHGPSLRPAAGTGQISDAARTAAPWAIAAD
jgi:hypothetical protein